MVQPSVVSSHHGHLDHCRESVFYLLTVQHRVHVLVHELSRAPFHVPFPAHVLAASPSRFYKTKSSEINKQI